MIDSFLKWSRRNPEKAKELDDFLNEALIAAAKRCESCLSRALGISFSRIAGEVPEAPARPPPEGPPIDLDHTDSLFEQTPLERVLTDAEALYRRAESSPRPEVVPDHEDEVPHLDEVQLDETALPEAPSGPPEPEGVESRAETPSDEDISGPSIDSLEAKGPPAEDYETAGHKRAFESDFDLIEPGPFDVESRPRKPQVPSEGPDMTTEDSDRTPVKEPEEQPVSHELSEAKLPEALDQLERDFSSHGLSISPTEPDLETDFPIKEEPSEPEEPAIDRAEAPPDELSIPVESDETGPEEVEVEQPLAETPPKAEPSLAPKEEEVQGPEDESEDNLESFVLPDELPRLEPEKPEVKPEEPESHPPPPPPPPPESDETDEERRKRARRLFFGT